VREDDDGRRGELRAAVDPAVSARAAAALAPM